MVRGELTFGDAVQAAVLELLEQIDKQVCIRGCTAHPQRGARLARHFHGLGELCAAVDE